jgi:hypothetical protein
MRKAESEPEEVQRFVPAIEDPEPEPLSGEDFAAQRWHTVCLINLAGMMERMDEQVCCCARLVDQSVRCHARADRQTLWWKPDLASRLQCSWESFQRVAHSLGLPDPIQSSGPGFCFATWWYRRCCTSVLPLQYCRKEHKMPPCRPYLFSLCADRSLRQPHKGYGNGVPSVGMHDCWLWSLLLSAAGHLLLGHEWHRWGSSAKLT